MAIRVSELVWQLAPAEVPPRERLVLLCLADHCRAKGMTAWPSVTTIAQRTSVSRRTVLRILPRLKAKGFLVAVGKSRRRTMTYRLNVERFTAATCQDGTDRVKSVPQKRACVPNAMLSVPSFGTGMVPSFGTRSVIEPLLDPLEKSGCAAFPPSQDTTQEEDPDHKRRENLAQLAAFLKRARSMP